MEVPKAFKLLVFRPASPAKTSSDLAVEYVYTGIVTNIRPVCSITNFTPKIPGGVEGEIYDRRLASADAVVSSEFNYRSTSWLSTAQVVRLPGFESYSKFQASRKQFVPILVKGGKGETPFSTKARTKYAVLAIMLLCSACLIIFVYKTKKGTYHNKT